MVTLGEPFMSTTEEESKPVPLIVKVKDAPPAAVEVGLMLVVVGSGWPG